MCSSAHATVAAIALATTLFGITQAVAPQFSVPGTPGTLISVSESSIIGKSIYKVIAIDVDGDTVSYSLAAQIPTTSPYKFALSSSTGTLTTATEFDYDLEGSVKSYELTIRATDGSNNVDTGVVIQITDDNDNAPYFINLYHTMENAAVGSLLTTLRAADADAGNNGAIRFEIMSGNQGGAFAIGEDSGQLTVAQELDFDAQASYLLVLKAKDGGSTPKSATMTVTINVIESAENVASGLTIASASMILICLFVTLLME